MGQVLMWLLQDLAVCLPTAVLLWAALEVIDYERTHRRVANKWLRHKTRRHPPSGRAVTPTRAHTPRHAREPEPETARPSAPVDVGPDTTFAYVYRHQHPQKASHT